MLADIFEKTLPIHDATRRTIKFYDCTVGHQVFWVKHKTPRCVCLDKHILERGSNRVAVLRVHPLNHGNAGMLYRQAVGVILAWCEVTPTDSPARPHGDATLAACTTQRF
jgi:hypothetical protein